MTVTEVTVEEAVKGAPAAAAAPDAPPDAPVQAEEEVISVKASCFERLIIKYPCACCWSWVGFALLWTVIFMAMMNSEKVKFDTNGVWDVRGHPTQSRFDAFMQARIQVGSDEKNLASYEERTVPFMQLHMLLISKEGESDLLSPANLAFLKKAEDKVFALKSLQKHCQITLGANPSVAPRDFVSLDPATDVVTLSGTVEDGVYVIFRGTSSKLVDGGRYTAVRSGSGYLLHVVEPSMEPMKVNFDAAGDISAGSQFFVVKEECTAMLSPTSLVYRNQAKQKEALCSGFGPVSRSSAGGSYTLPVFPKVCGCDADDVAGGSGCGLNCTSTFGVTPQCTTTRQVEAAVAVSDITANLGLLCTDAAIPESEKMSYKTLRQQTLPASWRCSGTTPTSNKEAMRSIFYIGGPLPGYKHVAGSTVNKQTTELIEWGTDLLGEIQEIEADLNSERDDDVRIIILSSFLLEPAYMSLMSVEGLNAFGSVLFVWAWVWCSTGSMLLATCCIFETVISIPMAIAVWGIIGMEYVGFLCVMMIFVILGIGADDVFVLFDAWKQSESLKFDGLESRFSWAYRRAGGAMFVTTITTVFCFVAAGFAEVPTISGFGWIAALIVLWDYFLVMTLFASAVMVYYKYFERKNACCRGRCTGHMLCCPLEFLFGERKNIWMAAISIPPMLIGLIIAIFASGLLGTALICIGIISLHMMVTSGGEKDGSRPIERFFETHFFNFMKKWSWVSLALFFLIIVGLAITAGLGLRLPEENEKFLQDDHPIQLYFESASKFSSGGNPMMTTLNVVFGIDKEDALDRTGVDFQQPGTTWGKAEPDEPLGKVQYSTTSRDNLYSAAGQQEVLGFCNDVRRTPSISKVEDDCELVSYKGVTYPRLVLNKNAPGLTAVGTGVGQYFIADPSQPLSAAGSGFCNLGIYCFMYDVREYIENFCGVPSRKANVVSTMGAAFDSLCKDTDGNAISGTFPQSNLGKIIMAPGYKQYIDSVARSERFQNGMSYDDYARAYYTGIGREGSEFKFAWVGMNASFPLGIVSYTKQLELHDRFENFVNSRFVVNKDAYMTSFLFTWMVTTQSLLSNTIQSVIVALIFCWFVLVGTTRNVIAGSLALLAVASVVVSAAGFIVIVGWKMGIIECIACIVIIGVSVDYSVHIVHSYNHGSVAPGLTKTEEREARVKAALGSIGISLVSGLMTSLGSTLFLFFCAINFFRKFGIFLFITLSISFVVTFLFLVPLLFKFGPAGGFCDLRLPAFVRSKLAGGTKAQGAQ